MVNFRCFFRQYEFRMTDFSMKLHGVWAILCWNTFLSLRSSRRLQIINARYKDIEDFKFEYKDVKGFSCKHPKVNEFIMFLHDFAQKFSGSRVIIGTKY